MTSAFHEFKKKKSDWFDEKNKLQKIYIICWKFVKSPEIHCLLTVVASDEQLFDSEKLLILIGETLFHSHKPSTKPSLKPFPQTSPKTFPL